MLGRLCLGEIVFVTKRVYDGPDDSDGYRVLVDRLWPRGVSKEAARLDEWLKEIAPSTELRTWYHGQHGDAYDEFVRRYRTELDANGAVVDHLRDLGSQHQVVTLLYGTRDAAHNHADVLAAYLAEP